MNGKGDSPRNCFSKEYRDNYDKIDFRTRKGSEEWLKIVGQEMGRRIIVLDPDGWDRKNFEESWAEKISKEEFCHRLNMSTTQIFLA